MYHFFSVCVSCLACYLRRSDNSAHNKLNMALLMPLCRYHAVAHSPTKKNTQIYVFFPY